MLIKQFKKTIENREQRKVAFITGIRDCINI